MNKHLSNHCPYPDDKCYFDGLNGFLYDDSCPECDLQKLEYLYSYELERHRRNLNNMTLRQYLWTY